MKRVALILAAVAALGLAGGAGFVWSGLYDVSATDQHLPHVYWLIEKTMHHSVARRGERISVPPLGAPEQLSHGYALYRRHCVQCHGAPGVPPEPFALGLTPLPVPLVQTGREWPPSRTFWVVKYGLKMTAMPAWEFRMSDADLWAVVAFVHHLPWLTPEDYRRLDAPAPEPNAQRAGSHRVDPERGRIALRQYGCAACHVVPGVTGPEARVGPPLAGIGAREMLGGVLPNSPENMVRWIRNPQRHSPVTAMPDLGVTERDARDIAAYLATLK